ncbi:hypothetical protein O0L34_g16086 [Tuta absoluta]|nr:hypothetical protein O0L34_g16086 [Tuta absoluta]
MVKWVLALALVAAVAVSTSAYPEPSFGLGGLLGGVAQGVGGLVHGILGGGHGRHATGVFGLLNNIAGGLSNVLGFRGGWLRGLQNAGKPNDLDSTLLLNFQIAKSNCHVIQQRWPELSDIYDRLQTAHTWISVCQRGRGGNLKVCAEKYKDISCPWQRSSLDVFRILRLVDGNGRVNVYDQIISIVLQISQGKGLDYFKNSSWVIIWSILQYSLFVQNNFNNLDSQSYAICTKYSFTIFGAISEAHKKGSGIEIIIDLISITNVYYQKYGLGCKYCILRLQYNNGS